MLCLFNYHLKYECEVWLYSINESTMGRIMWLEWDLLLIARKSSCPSSSHACKYSLAKKRLWYFPALVEKITSVSSGPVTVPWPRGSAMCGSREYNRDQGSSEQIRNSHQYGKPSLWPRLQVSQHQWWTMVIRSRRLFNKEYTLGYDAYVKGSSHLWHFS